MGEQRELTRALLRNGMSGKADGRRELAVLLRERVLELRAIERKETNQSYLDRLQRGYSWLWKAYDIPDDSDLEARFLLPGLPSMLSTE